MHVILIFALLSVFYPALAHDGSHDEAGSIKDGKLDSKDGITYLDAGALVQWGKYSLKRKVEGGRVLYQYVGEPGGATNDEGENALSLKAPGGQLLKSFSFERAGDRPSPLVMHSPDFSSVVEISKHADFPIQWEVKKKGSLIKIIVEVRSKVGDLAGRLTISTDDDGEFSIPSGLLSRLPEGNAKVAIKRVWFGGFHPFGNDKEMVGVRTAASVVGKAKIIE